MEGGSVGFQIGGSDTDLVLLVMNKRGMVRLTEDKVQLRRGCIAYRGPSRPHHEQAETKDGLAFDGYGDSQSLVLTAKGLFAGVSLSGASLRPDADRNAELYGSKNEQ